MASEVDQAVRSGGTSWCPGHLELPTTRVVTRHLGWIFPWRCLANPYEPCSGEPSPAVGLGLSFQFSRWRTTPKKDDALISQRNRPTRCMPKRLTIS